MQSIVIVIYMKDSSENLACHRNARIIRDVVVQDFRLVDKIQVSEQSFSRPIPGKTEKRKAVILA